MNARDFGHAPVMHDEVMQHIRVQPGGIYVDGTYGRGGHAQSILSCLGDNGRLIVMDKDPQAIEAAQKAIGEDSRVTILHDDYANMYDRLLALGLLQCIDGILLDMGVSSPQLDDATRGFSFQKNGQLDMRMDTTQGQSAAQWLARADEAEISRVLWEYGEERHSRRIARKIVEVRQQTVIEDTASLANLISQCVPQGKHHKHPATRSFQAIRIHINQELAQISRFLDSLFDLLKIGGRILVISFHSLEDRLVKRFFKLHSSKPKIPRGLPVKDTDLIASIRLNRVGKAIMAGVREVEGNPRARSAVLRIAERAS